MKLLKGNSAISILLVVIVVATGLYYFLPTSNNGVSPQTITLTRQSHEIDFASKVPLTDLEREQVVNSVDAYMSEYRLPEGVPNSYVLVVERRVNDVMEVIIDPEKVIDAHHNLYLRKINSVWQVDPVAGPWCTLEEFEQSNCY